MYNIEYTNEFGDWWDSLSEPEQIDVAAVIFVLEKMGTKLGFPYSSQIKQSKHGHMRELRIQHNGQPYRVLYAFNPKRSAILLIGGNKKGDNRWYKKIVPLADRLYEKHLQEMGANNG